MDDRNRYNRYHPIYIFIGVFNTDHAVEKVEV